MVKRWETSEVSLSTSTNVGPGMILRYVPTYLLEFRMEKNLNSLPSEFSSSNLFFPAKKAQVSVWRYSYILSMVRYNRSLKLDSVPYVPRYIPNEMVG